MKSLAALLLFALALTAATKVDAQDRFEAGGQARSANTSAEEWIQPGPSPAHQGLGEGSGQSVGKL